MTALEIPSLHRRLVKTLRDEVENEPIREWDPESLQLCLKILRDSSEKTARVRQSLEELLAGGVEARSFARGFGPLLGAVEEHAANVRGIGEHLSKAKGALPEAVAAELAVLARETLAYRDLLSEALARSTEPPRPADPERVRASEETYARGEAKPFSGR